MAAIQLYRNEPVTYTTISNTFIDQYMADANGEYVKVYLLLLRFLQSGKADCTVSVIADLLDHTEKDIQRAIKYWEKQGLLVPSYDVSGTLESIGFGTPTAESVSGPVPSVPVSSASIPSAQVPSVPVSSAPVSSAQVSSVPVSSAQVSSAQVSSADAKRMPEPHQYTPDEINSFNQKTEIQELFFIISTYIKTTLSDTDINTVLFWYDELKFPTDLIEYLVEYCISKGHSSIRYMNKVALGWAENNITTIEEAKDNVQIHNRSYYAVMKALGIYGRNLVPAENDFISKWTGDYGFSLELIQEACARTISATHQPSFEYTDSILTNWFKKNIHTLDEVRAADQQFAQRKKAGKDASQGAYPAGNPSSGGENGNSRIRFNNFHQRSYDEDELERMLLNPQAKS